MQTLDDDGRDETASFPGFVGVGGVAGRSEVLGILSRQAVVQVELLKSGADEGRISCVREVAAVGRAGHERGPEGAALVASGEARDVDVAGEVAVLEEGRECGVVDLVLVPEAEENHQIIMTV